MNIFFYSSVSSIDDGERGFLKGPLEYYTILRRTSSAFDISFLSKDSLFYPTMDSPQRYGDLLLLYIADHKDLECLLEKKRCLEQFRIILIVDEDVYQKTGKCHLLNPRFIMTTDQSATILKEVVENIMDKVAKETVKRQPISPTNQEPTVG